MGCGGWTHQAAKTSATTSLIAVGRGLEPAGSPSSDHHQRALRVQNGKIPEIASLRADILTWIRTVPEGRQSETL